MEGPPLIKTLSEYIAYMEHKVFEKVNQVRKTHPYIEGTEDVMQIPLQPLANNLDAGTYEIFEKDPVKYTIYKSAIREAIQDRINKDDLVLMVVGAGRGPLVTASVMAAKDLKKAVTIYVVEKNHNAIPTLELEKEMNWGNSEFVSEIRIFETDMRTFSAPKKADIVVSELLGSFGDNELAPECLDGVWKSVKQDCISIPCKYTSFIRPIMSQRLFNEINALVSGKDGFSDNTKAYETSYVVNIHNYYTPFRSKEAFVFEHKEGDLSTNPEKRSNERFTEVSFSGNPIDLVVHGFAGYFDTVLYKEHKLSINPQTFSYGMFSWFPIFFPLHKPIFLPSKTKMTVEFRRVVSPHSVWYEWNVSQPVMTEISNSHGRSEKMGLQT
jgi:protein arginine N-methyltransferase 5